MPSRCQKCGKLCNSFDDAMYCCVIASEQDIKDAVERTGRYLEKRKKAERILLDVIDKHGLELTPQVFAECHNTLSTLSDSRLEEIDTRQATEILIQKVLNKEQKP